MRKGKDPSDYVIVACNFTPVPRTAYRIGVPELCAYDEVFNSDSMFYAGSNAGNGAGLVAEPIEHHARAQSLEVVLPPLAAVVLKPRR